MDGGAGILIAYATAPGDVASPGPKEGYSPFTEVLANELRASDASIRQVFDDVSTKFYNQSPPDHRQAPYVEASVFPSLSFKAGQIVRKRPPAETPGSQAADIYYTFALVPKNINNPFFDEARDGCMNAQAQSNGKITCEYIGPRRAQ